ncbi:MAG: hypothetical protein DRI69_02830 [Bacteroidetes bacterium]|nr:MAG: hypothetical protein DRI69_02830 [Bacteroidota bacterium]
MLNRKEFIQQVMAVSAGTALMGFSSIDRKWIMEMPHSKRLDFLTFDLHAHPGRFYRKGLEGYTGDEALIKTVGEMNTAGLSGVFFSMVVDTLVTKRTSKGIAPKRKFKKGEAWAEYKRQLAQLRELCEKNGIRQATRLSDLTQYNEDSGVAAYFACEGGDFLESTDQLDEMYADGVRSIQLVHYAPNPLGDLQTSKGQHDGLSDTGKAMVRKMNDLGIVIDVAHASYKTVQDVADTTESPIILSHSILKLDEDRPISARAITPAHANLVASTGGVIGAWPSGFNTNFEDYVDNILRLIDVVGVERVGLGTDMDSNYKPVLDSYLQLEKLCDALKAKGLSDQEVHAIAGGNAERVLQRVF